MGSHMSKKAPETNLHDTTTSEHLTSYSAACQADETLRTFDATLHARTSHAINTLASGVEVQALSFDSLREVTECLLEMNQEVVKVILDCKKDIWKNQELFDLVEEYFENSLQTLDFCTALEKCLKRVRDSQLLIMVALQQFDQEDAVAAADGSITSESKTDRYARTLEDLKHFKEQAREPFTEEFLQIFHSVYKQQMSMLEKLQMRKNKLDKKLKYIHAWRRVSSIIFAASFAALLICSVVAAAVAAPPLAAALAAATSIPLGSMGKWIDSLWRSYEMELKGQKELIATMQVGSYIAIKDLDSIRVLIDKLVVEIEGLVGSVDVAVGMEGEGEDGEEAVRLVIAEIKKRLGAFMKNVEDLGVQADVCSRDIRKARTVVLQRIIKPPTN